MYTDGVTAIIPSSLFKFTLTEENIGDFLTQNCYSNLEKNKGSSTKMSFYQLLVASATNVYLTH